MLISQRKKENPGLSKNARSIKQYYISSEKQLDNTMDEIIKLCEVFNARAGIRLNKRSFKRCAFENLRKLSEIIYSEDFKHARNQFNKSAGSVHESKGKTWILDIDKEDLTNYNDIKKFINNLGDDLIVAEIPSKSGIHIITKPFDRTLFNFNIEIHKDNPTNLIII